MHEKKPHDEATVATAEAGVVILDGPDGIALSLTPEAAAESALRMGRASEEARRQRDGHAEAGASAGDRCDVTRYRSQPAAR